MFKKINRRKNQKGAVLAEYAIAAAIIIPVVIAAFFVLGPAFRKREVKAFEGMQKGSIPSERCAAITTDSDDCL